MKPDLHVMSERVEALARLCEQFQVQILYAFGSRAQDARSWLAGSIEKLAAGPSDLDVGVKVRAGTTCSVFEKVRLAQALEELLGVRRVDLVVMDQADPFLAANVIRGERLYAADAHAADEYDLYVLRRAGDLAPLERERQSLVLREKQ